MNLDEILIRKLTLPQAYHASLVYLNDAPITPCPDWNTEQKELSMTMVVDDPLKEPRISRLFYGDPHSLEQYRQEMLDGILDFEVEKGNWSYTYHSRYAWQYPALVEELKRNPWSRRAVLNIRSDDDVGSSDPACWQHAQYFIRDGALHCKVLFRSNDACKAAFMNAFALICLQEKLANELGVEVGSYTHRANSYHCYARDFDLLKMYVQRIRKNSREELVWHYKGNWDELMEDARHDIAKMVAAQKAKVPNV